MTKSNDDIPGVIYIAGLPGAGKGTYSEMIISDYPAVHINVGKELRKQMEQNTELSQIIRNCVTKGELVPPKTAVQTIEACLQTLRDENILQERNIILIDGFPRNLENYIAWCESNLGNSTNLLYMLYLDCPKEVCIERCLSRMEGRSDDVEEVLKKRHSIFFEETIPLIELLKDQDIVYTIDTNRDIEIVYEDIKLFFNSYVV